MRYGGSEPGSSQKESIVLMTMLRAMCVCVCVYLINTREKAGEHGYTGLTVRLTGRVVACLLCNMFKVEER